MIGNIQKGNRTHRVNESLAVKKTLDLLTNQSLAVCLVLEIRDAVVYCDKVAGLVLNFSTHLTAPCPDLEQLIVSYE